MLNKLVSFNNKHQLFFDNNKLILATSGGIDSMVLLNLLKNLDVELIIAHCNFTLRGKESDKDQTLVKCIAEQNELVFQTINFDTQKYAQENKLSIEEAARILRYEWFEKIRKELNANLIVTAHHLNDNTETLLFNITKGTGIKGLRGMLPKRGKIIRPLLEISRAEIEKFAQEKNIAYREDASNNSLEYSRNLIRKNIIPELNKVNTSFLKTQVNHFDRFREIELFYNDVVEKLKKELFKEKKGDFYLSINKLLKFKGFRTLLFEILNQYDFSNHQVDDILELILNNKAVSGKTFFSKTYRIIKDRKHLILSEFAKESTQVFDLAKNKNTLKLPNEEMIRIHIKPIEKLTKMSAKNHYAYLDLDKLVFPLILRKWKEGDYFYPFGMYRNGKAKKKKIKKYFSDLKLSIVDKENIWILTSGEKIVWLVNHRIDDRFKVNEQTKNVYQLRFVECKN